MWRNLALALALGACLGTSVSGAAWADEAPDPETVRRAKNAFEEATSAYRAEHWELAASRFEAADEAVPEARTLRMAMRAREKAGQKARAATLAAAALQRYPADDKTVALANEVLDALRGDLHELVVTCAEPCILTVGTRVVPGRRSESWTVYFEPGAVRLSAGFEAGGPASHAFEAKAGESETVTLAPSAAEAKTEAEPVPAPAPSPAPPPKVASDAPAESFFAHPGVFIAGLVATAGLGGVTIWSGIDTLQDPGEDRVREACRGEGPDCAEYQRGLDKQLRTNVLIGATAAMGVITGIIGIAVTDWGGEDVEASASVAPGAGMFQLTGRF